MWLGDMPVCIRVAMRRAHEPITTTNRRHTPVSSARVCWWRVAAAPTSEPHASRRASRSPNASAVALSSAAMSAELRP